MALARLVTRTPEFAQNLARSLEEAGYSVEFASPDIVSHGALVGLPLGPADLEVNLDDPSAAASYLMTADGKEICFAYDPCEREFVLAPAWRRFKVAFAPVLENFQRAAARRREARNLKAARLEAARIENGRREYERETARAEAARLESHRLELTRMEAARLEQQRLEAERLEQRRAEADRLAAARNVPEPTPAYNSDPAPTTVMPTAAEPATNLYLHEPTFFSVEAERETQPVEFSGADYFDGQGARRLTERERSAPELPREAPIDAASAPLQEQTESPARTPWLVTAALRAEALRRHLSAQWSERRNAMANSRLREYDAAWLRAVPVAAIITMAFLVGWASSNSQRASTPPTVKPVVGNPSTVDSAAIDAIAVSEVEKLHQASAAPVSTAPVAAKATPTLRRVSRKSTVNVYDEDAEDYDVAPDVVIRHYPAKNARTAQASAQKPSIKRISDLD